MNTKSEEVKRLEENVAEWKKIVAEAEAALALARQRLEQEPQGAESAKDKKYWDEKTSKAMNYITVDGDGDARVTADSTTYFISSFHPFIVTRTIDLIIAAERRAQDQQTTERIEKALETVLANPASESAKAAAIRLHDQYGDLTTWIRQGCPQPKDAEPPTPACKHDQVRFDEEADNFYCMTCKAGMGEAYYDQHIQQYWDKNKSPAPPQRMTAREIAGKMVHDYVAPNGEKGPWVSRHDNPLYWVPLVHSQTPEYLRKYIARAIQSVMDQPKDAATKEMIVREWIEGLSPLAIRSACDQWRLHSANGNEDAKCFRESLLASFNKTGDTE